MNCLVLGGAGFMGSHLCDALIAKNHNVRVFERKGFNSRNIEHIINRLDIVEGDFSDPNAVYGSLKGIEIVFHLIGTTQPQSSNVNIPYDITSNIVATVKMLDGCVRSGIKKVIFASSGGTVYGIPQQVPISEEHPTNPICSYGIHKLAIEKYLQLYHHLYELDYTVLRISNPYGPRQPADKNQGAVAVFTQRALRNEPIEIWGDGSVIRDYVYVSDVIQAFLKAIEQKSSHKIFNIGSGSGHTLIEIVHQIEKEIDKQVGIRFSTARKIDVPVNILAIERAKHELDWTPTITFRQGISNIL